MRHYRVLCLLLAVSVFTFAQGQKSVTDRLATQNALFEEQYESDLRNFPERATSSGDYRFNDKLGDYSLAAIQQRHKTDESFLKRLEAIPTHGFSDQDQLSHDLLVRVLKYTGKLSTPTCSTMPILAILSNRPIAATSR